MQIFSKPLFDTRGFSIRQLGVAVAVIAFMGASAGLVVRAIRADAPEKPIVAVEGKKVKEELTAKPSEFTPAAVIPEGYTVYRNDDYGFSFAYPSTWGQLTSSGKDIVATGDVTKIGSDTHGSLIVATYEAGQMFRPVPYVSGPTLRPIVAGGMISWKVVAVTPAYDGYSLGDNYVAKVARVVPNGGAGRDVSVYEFTTTKDGTTTTSWIFVTPKGFVHIAVPYLSEAYDYDNHPIPGDKEGYVSLKKTILQSIEISSLVQ